MLYPDKDVEKVYFDEGRNHVLMVTPELLQLIAQQRATEPTSYISLGNQQTDSATETGLIAETIGRLSASLPNPGEAHPEYLRMHRLALEGVTDPESQTYNYLEEMASRVMIDAQSLEALKLARELKMSLAFGPDDLMAVSLINSQRDGNRPAFNIEVAPLPYTRADLEPAGNSRHILVSRFSLKRVAPVDSKSLQALLRVNSLEAVTDPPNQAFNMLNLVAGYTPKSPTLPVVQFEWRFAQLPEPKKPDSRKDRFFNFFQGRA